MLDQRGSLQVKSPAQPRQKIAPTTLSVSGVNGQGHSGMQLRRRQEQRNTLKEGEQADDAHCSGRRGTEFNPIGFPRVG